MGTVEMIFEVGEDVAAAAAGLPKKPVDIVCESSEFSVDRRWMKSEWNTPKLAASCVSPEFAQFSAETHSRHATHNKSVGALSTNPQRSSQQQALLVSRSKLKGDK